MPRAVWVPKGPLKYPRGPPGLLQHGRPDQRPDIHIKPGTPKLWNAKRRVKIMRGLVPGSQALAKYKKDPLNEDWKAEVSPDVVDFIEKAETLKKPLLPDQKLLCMTRPSIFFSRPQNVLPELRKPIYFPDFRITFMRTPHLPPKYAAFDVPTWFNKLDMKSFLREAYKVEIIHVRSTVIQGKVKRRPTGNAKSQGPLFREPNKKKMTVELLEPFVWPEEVKDFSAWEKDQYWKASKAQFEQQRLDSDWAKSNPNEKHRKSIAEQAKELLSGKATWSPTWKEIPMDVTAIQGQNLPPPPR